MPNVMAAQPYIGGALCESSVILFLVPPESLDDPAAGVPRSNAANRGTQVLDTKCILHVAKFHQRARASGNVYIVYQPKRWPNIVQGLVALQWATSLQ